MKAVGRFNLCRGEGVTVRELVTRIATEMRADPGLLRWGGVAPVGPQWAVGNPQRMREATGWHWSTDLPGMVRNIVSGRRVPPRTGDDDSI